MKEQFSEDILRGLSGTPKYISPKYFYDEEGSKIFGNITEIKEYYPTRCEHEILEKYKAEILDYIHEYHETFQVIELGAGNGLKTRVLLEHFIQKEADFSYIPVDICHEENKKLADDLNKQFPMLQVTPVNSDFISSIKLPGKKTSGRVILFLGSTIGNLHHSEALEFLGNIRKQMEPDDLLIIGFDLKKHPRVIAEAYNDSKGLTRDFNLNLLNRINYELDANFDLSMFEHYPHYDPITGEAKSFLVSSVSQQVHIKKLDSKIKFEEGEVIFTEVSRKFSPDDILDLAMMAGFERLVDFSDTKGYFIDSIWRK